MERYINVTLPSLGRVGVRFYSCAESTIDLYDRTDEFSRQKNIKQLGLIADEFEGASHSRYEYLMLQCALSELLDNVHKGTMSAAQGSIKIDGMEYFGNAVIKSWFMLSNFGHTKNTYGDEKSLCLYAMRSKYLRNVIVNAINDGVLKAWCDKVLLGFQYQHFHYVLAAYRIYKELPRRVKEQKFLVDLLKLLVVPYADLDVNVNREKLEQLRVLFKKVRDIAIVSIDGHYSHSPISVDLISSLVSFDLYEGGLLGKTLSKSIKSVRSFLHDDIYLNPNVLARQRQYEIDSLNYIKSVPKNAAAYRDMINKALTSGLVDRRDLMLTHFCRLPISKQMQPETDFYDEFRNLTIKTKRSCKSADSYLDVNPYTKVRYADFFIREDKFSYSDMAPFLFAVCKMIDAQIEHLINNVLDDYFRFYGEVRANARIEGVHDNTIERIINKSDYVMMDIGWRSAIEQVFPIFRNLLWSCIRYFMKENFRLELKDGEIDYEMYSIDIPRMGDWYMLQNIDIATQFERGNPDRVHELMQLKRMVKNKFDGYRIACLVRVDVVDVTKPPNKRKVTDIDSILLSVNEREFKLELNESKNMGSRSVAAATKDIRDKLVKTLSKNARGYRVMPVRGMGAKLVIKR